MKSQPFLVILLLSLLIAGCGEIKESSEAKPISFSGSHIGLKGISPSKALAQKKVKLLIGQDLRSVRAYVKTSRYPDPAGVTTYLSFYNLLNPNFPSYGALGIDARGYPTNVSVDWGAGPLNAHAIAKEYPKTILNIGLNIAEGNSSQVWVDGGLKAIAGGRYDREINRLAVFFKSIKNPVYLRIGYEFDGVWNKGYENTHAYIRAYRHIVNQLRAKQLSNVAFVWQASASPIDDIIESKHENISQWYPGDNYVDWVGLSWFLSSDKVVKKAATQRYLANEVLRFSRLKQKPVIIAEASPQGYDLSAMTQSNISPVWDGEAGKNKSTVTASQVWRGWFVPFFTFIRENSDVIKAVAYVNADWDSQELWAAPYLNGYWGDSRVQVNSEISRRWLSEISDESLWLK